MTNPIEGNNTDYNTLSIQVSLDGFSFLVKNELSQEVIYSHQLPLPYQATPQLALVKMEQVFRDNKELQQNFKKVTVVYSNELYTVVPEALFDKEKLTDYLKYNAKLLKNDFIVYDEISQFDLVNIYVPYANINNFFFEQIGSFTFYHGITLLLQKVLSQKTSTTTLSALVRSKSFDLVISQGNNLLLVNTFEYSNAEDFAYHTLFCIEQLKLDTEEVLLKLYGDLKKEDSIFKMLYKFIRNVEIINEAASSELFLLQNI